MLSITLVLDCEEINLHATYFVCSCLNAIVTIQVFMSITVLCESAWWVSKSSKNGKC